ncbi:MAG: phosphoribosylaminoimidazolesuccinocarboxamide synthase [Bacillota bacterium]|nr:phosphoribosylaminoimidazolesuccinocarboxamide synthase [Thermoanaerobacteraceae bacterium]
MGSVKDLVVLKKPKKGETGSGRFVFSDRYSVFDWGEMPDQITEKGKAICLATAYFFERLAEMGIKTHYLGVVEDGVTKRLGDLQKPSDTMEVKLLRVLKPKIRDNAYDYSVYREEKGNFLIPLEVIYRNSLPEGSSVFRRLREGSLTLDEIGLREMPAPAQVLEKPLLDVSTKLEAADRYINWEEARAIAGLAETEIEEIRRVTLAVNDLITAEAKKLGLFNEDGKVEFGFDQNRALILVDALGTLDECRFTFEGIPVSKEIARMFYRQTEWSREVEEAKKKNKIGWKDLVKAAPPQLPERLKNAIAMIYKAYTNELTGRKWFDTPPLKEVLAEIKEFTGQGEGA